MEADDEGAQIEDDDIIEVIDLDEGEEEPVDDEDDDDGESAEGFSSTQISPARKDNSERDFDDHGGSKCSTLSLLITVHINKPIDNECSQQCNKLWGYTQGGASGAKK